MHEFSCKINFSMPKVKYIEILIYVHNDSTVGANVECTHVYHTLYHSLNWFLEHNCTFNSQLSYLVLQCMIILPIGMKPGESKVV